MKHTILKKWLAAWTACAVFAVGIPALPISSTAAETNLISNATFDTSTSGWAIYTESGGSATLGTEDGKLALTISDIGTLSYAVQLYYDIIPLYQNGVYHLSYEISSTTDRYVEAMIQQNGGTYQAYTWKGLNLTEETQTVDYTFTMTAETDIMAKLVFNCGDEGEELDEHTIYLDNVTLELIDDSEVDDTEISVYEPSIVVNQVGYYPDSEKIAVFRDVTTETEFSVVNADTGEVVYTDVLYGETINTSADETDYYGDFSTVTETGTYYITCGDLDDSYSFEIRENVYDALLDDTVRMLYLQRCGTEIEDETFGHDACHTTEATIYGTDETIDVSGGWHDAGDYGRYVVPAAKTVADLLYAYDANPTLYSDNSGIPESGNGIADILDEVRYELEWMLKMQADSGGVYHKVTCETFPGYVMPEEETDELIVTPISTTATADFCAVMAMAYEFYGEIDSEFAETCLDAAEKAWAFLEENPNLIFEDPEDISTGDYSDYSDKDERYWAAAQMYRATGSETYLTELESMTARTGLDWSTVGDYGNIAILTMDGIDTDSTIYTKAETAVLNQANKFVTTTEKSPYSVAITSFNWGSNMTIANAGTILGLAYQLTGTEDYLTCAQSNLNYLLGKNPNGVCYVTGYGTVSPENPHHRPSMAQGQAMPGMLVGGVNSNLEDSAAIAYLSDTPSAKCYVDNSESYSTNEVTTYWNSSLIYLLSLTNVTAETSVSGDVNADGTFSLADIVMLQQYLLGNDSLTRWKNGDLNEDGLISGLDLSVMRQLLLTTSSTVDDTTILDYGTELDTTATMIADFREGESDLFYASSGWSNGDPFDCGWYADNATISDGALQLVIDTDSTGTYAYSGGEYRSTDFYSYGYYEVSMQAIANDGVVSSFFLYTGPSDDNPWDEIDIEILGKDTTQVQFNYYTNGVGNHEFLYDLGFDASEGYHTYGFDWQEDSITWYVDGVAVYSVTEDIPSTPGRIMMNVWPGTGVDSWLSAYDGTTPLTARYQWVTFQEK